MQAHALVSFEICPKCLFYKDLYMDRVDGTPRMPHTDPHTGTPITFDGTHK